MAIIYTYPVKTSPVAADKVLISDSEDDNKTKSVTIEDIRGATTTGVSSIIAGTSNVTLDPAGGTGDVTVSVSGSADTILETVRNNSGATIEKGQPLHITGVNGTTPTVEVADASNLTKMPVSGLANEQILNNADGEMIISGVLEGVDTANINGSPTEAAVLYVNTTTGGSIDFLTTVAPKTESNLIQNIGIIIKDSPGTSGSIQVTAIGRTNATPNLNEGSLFIGNSAGESRTLTIGANSTVLTSNGTTASWQTTMGGTGTQYQIPAFSSSNVLTDSILTNVPSGTVRVDVGGIVRSSGGTASEPAYSFVSDPNTGIANLGPDTLTLIGGGQSSFIVSNTTITSSKVHQFDATAGFKFGPSGDVMNNYDEGTWTPTAVAVVGTAPTVTNALGSYTRIGDLVNIRFSITVTGSSQNNVAMIVGGLPFTADNNTGSISAGNLYNNTDSNTPANYPSVVRVSGTQLLFYLHGSTKNSATSPVGLEIDSTASWYRPVAGTGITLEGSATYKVA